MRTRLAALLLAALALAACGKYGPPVRSQPSAAAPAAEIEAAPAPEAETTPAPDPDERDAGEEAPQ